MNYFDYWKDSLAGGISQTKGLYLHKTREHKKKMTNIHAVSGIGTQNLND
jgi:hypothetical protein